MKSLTRMWAIYLVVAAIVVPCLTSCSGGDANPGGVTGTDKKPSNTQTMAAKDSKNK